MQFTHYKTFAQIDASRFSAMVRSGFGKTLSPGYFSYCDPSFICVAEEHGQYCGAIVVEEIAQGVYYLDKIVVRKELQGNGIGKTLWQILNAKAKKVIWRAKADNPINAFYQKQCQGMQRAGEWIIYWIGLSPEELRVGIKYSLAKKPTLENSHVTCEESLAHDTQAVPCIPMKATG